MRIVFIHEGKAFLPEIDAYIQFFSELGISCEVARPATLQKIDADVYWHFMGTDLRNSRGITLHEYTSSSLPPLAQLKNSFKKIFNSRPQFRLFLNDYVKKQFSFRDQVPFGYRDMGISKMNGPGRDKMKEKKFDFIYTGEIRNRKIENLLRLFTSELFSQHSLLIVSNDYEEWARELESHRNIIFTGPVKRDEIKSLLAQSRFGINYIPDEEPFNHQTSTKLIEYAAAELPIISTDYSWIREFQKNYGGNYYYLEKGLTNMDWEKICSFNYSFPDLSEWTWEYQIKRSGVLEFLKTKFAGDLCV